jgi:hypothetical protein
VGAVAHWGRAGGYLRRGPNLHTMDGGGDQCADLTASVDLTVFERCDRRHRSAVRQRFIFWKAEKGRELHGGNYRPRDPVVARDAGAALDAALAAFGDVVGED